MQDKKKYIIVFIILGIYVIGVFLLFGKDIMKSKMYTSYLMVSPTTRWKFVKGHWSDAGKVSDYSLKPFEVYVGNKKFGTYNLTYNDKFYLFDNDRNPQLYDGNLIAYWGSLSMEVIDFQSEKVTQSDAPIIQKVLKENKLNISLDKLNMWKVEIDIDNDGKKEILYAVDNLFKENGETSAIAFLFILDDGKITYLHKKIESNKSTYSLCSPYVSNIIDIDKDKQYEIIMGCVYYSDRGTCHNLFDNKKNKYELLKGC